MTLHVHFAPFSKHLEKRFIVSLDDRKWYNGRYLLMCIFHSLFDILVTSINSTLRYSTWWLITHEKNNRFCCIWLSFLISYILCNIKNYLQFIKKLRYFIYRCTFYVKLNLDWLRYVFYSFLQKNKTQLVATSSLIVNLFFIC